MRPTSLINVVAQPGTPDVYRRRAREWAQRFDFFHQDDRVRQAVYQIPAALDYPGYVVRHLGDRVVAHVNLALQPTPVEEVEEDEAQETGLLVHGMVRNLFIGRGADVSVFDPLADPAYSELAKPQVTYSALNHAGHPKGWAPPSSDSPGWSHLVGIRPTLYSGWMRALVQSALGIGYGDPDGVNADPQTEYAEIDHRFKWPVSDGVLFVTPDYKPGFGPPSYAQNMRPVIVRIDGVTGRVLVADPRYWGGAFVATGDSWPGGEEWGEYLAAVEDEDPLVRLIVETFWGIPSGEDAFDFASNAEEDVLGVSPLQQRINSGLITEDNANFGYIGAPIASSHGWAFSYTQQRAAQVTTKYDPVTGWPKGTLVLLDFNIWRPVAPVPPAVPALLTQYLVYWAESAGIDTAALAVWAARLTQTQIGYFAAKVPDVAGFSNDALAREFVRTEVENPIYSMVMAVDTDLQGWIDNPVGGTKQVPKVHVKVPDYGLFVGCNTWRMPPPEGELHPPDDGLVPISCFFLRGGGMALTQLFSSTISYDDFSSGEASACSVGSHSTSHVDFSLHDRYRDAATNLHGPLDDVPPYTVGVSKSRSDFQFDKYSIQDDITKPYRGQAAFSKFFLQTTESYSRHWIPRQAAVVFPMFEREAVYIGYPPWGREAASTSIRYQRQQITSPYRVYYERCFPGYEGFQRPEFYDCSDVHRCGFRMYSERLSMDPGSNYDTACGSWFPSSPWAPECTNIDALYYSTLGLEVYVPDGEGGVLPSETQAEVFAIHSHLDGGLLQVTKQSGGAAGISNWWTEVTPNESGTSPWMSATANAIGDTLVMLDKDFYGEIRRVGGRSSTYPFSAASPEAIFLAHAIEA